MNKKYVSVIVEVDELGNKKPMAIIYEDKIYNVDRVLDVKSAVSMKVGGIGERYSIRINGQETYVFCERGRWFVESKRA